MTVPKYVDLERDTQGRLVISLTDAGREALYTIQDQHELFEYYETHGWYYAHDPSALGTLSETPMLSDDYTHTGDDGRALDEPVLHRHWFDGQYQIKDTLDALQEHPDRPVVWDVIDVRQPEREPPSVWEKYGAEYTHEHHGPERDRAAER